LSPSKSQAASALVESGMRTSRCSGLAGSGKMRISRTAVRMGLNLVMKTRMRVVLSGLNV